MILKKFIDKLNIFYASDSKTFYNGRGGGVVKDENFSTLCYLAGVPSDDPNLVESIRLELIKNGRPYNEQRSIYSNATPSKTKTKPKYLLKTRIDTAYQILKCHLPFIFVKKNEGGTFAYKRINENEVITVKTPENRDLISSLQSSTAKYKVFKEYYSEDQEAELIRMEMILNEFLEEIMNRAKEDEDFFEYRLPKFITWTKGELAFKYFDESILVDGPTPYYDNFCSRLDYPEVFMAWVWSIFEPQNNGRQIMWITGKGHDGKSTLFNALSAFIGKEHSGTISDGDFKSDFFFNEVYGRILLCYPDCSIKAILDHERIKNITGGDEQKINGKFAQPFKASVYSKVLVGSNLYPDVNMLFAYQKSRIIALTISSVSDDNFSGDNEALPSMIKETPAFLKKCRAVYGKYVEKNSSLKLPKELVDDMEIKCMSMEMNIVKDFCNEDLVFNESQKVSRLDVQSKFYEFLSNANLKGNASSAMPLFEEYVKSLHKYVKGVVPIKIGDKNTAGYIGFNIKENLNKGR